MQKTACLSIILTVFMVYSVENSFARSYPPTSAGEKNLRQTKIQLYNGKDLSGWYTFIKGKGKNIDPNRVFTIQNGLIHISGEEFGCITTDAEFENYTLEVEYKWGSMTYPPRVQNARDSGVLLNSTGEDGAFSGIWMHSIECQLIEGGTGDMLVVGDGSAKFSITCPVEQKKQGESSVFKPDGTPATIYGGRINWWGRDPDWKDVKGFRGARDLEKPIGQWNKLKCTVQGPQIFIYLNGKLVNHAIDVQPRKGHIQVQSEGAEILLKQIILTPLSPN